MDRRITDRKGQFKKNFDDPRRKREDIQVQIRKVSRDQNLLKKRVNHSKTTNYLTNEEEEGNTSFATPESILSSKYRTPIVEYIESMANTQEPIPTSNLWPPNNALAQENKPLGPFSDNSALPEDQQLWAKLVESVMSNDPTSQYEATMAFRKLLSIEKSPPIQAVVNSGVVPRFVEFLKESSRPELQFEAAWTLTNVASGNTLQTAEVVSENAIPIFVSLISSPRDDVSEQAVWALGNIAGDCAKYRNMVLQANALSALLDKMSQQTSTVFMRNATWALSNLCRGKPAPDFMSVAPCLPVLKELLYNTDEEILSDACWALSYLSDGQEYQIQVVINSEVIPLVINLLSHQSQIIQTPALRTIGNIVTGTDAQTQTVIEHGAVQKLHQLLHSPKRTLKREACWAISNITAGPQDQIQHIINHGLIPPLIKLLSGFEHDIQKEAAWAISNAATGGNAIQIDYLVASGCIPPLCGLLKISDTKIIRITLDAIDNILKIGLNKKDKEQLHVNPYIEYFDQNDNIPSIEALQDHEDLDISKKAWDIIRKYFPYEEEYTAGADGSFDDLNSIKAPTGGFDFSFI